MSLPGPETGTEQLLQCSLERTLLLHRHPASGGLEVHKLWLRGSPTDAEREFLLGRRLRGLDVVEYLFSGMHAATSRPFVATRYEQGTSLDQLVGERGAQTGAAACALLVPVARTLMAMHALRALDIPHGMCHGDIKPANLLATATTTLLLDFEHAGPTMQGACAGTAGFAGPEALVAAPLTPAFDVYGIGATLRWLLCGPLAQPSAIEIHDPELQLLIESCLSPSPTARPSAATVVEALTEIGQRLQHDPLEPARDALLSGDLAVCERTLAAASSMTLASDRLPISRALRRRQQLLARRPEVFAASPTIAATTPEQFAASLAIAMATARRFPRHSAVIAALHRGKQKALPCIAEALPTVSELARKEQFARAHELLQTLHRLVDLCSALPGPLGRIDTTPATMPSLLQRSPRTCLQQEAQRLVASETEHRQLLDTLHAAEEALALDDAAAVVERIGANFGGTAEAVARHRDRLHRLAFYLERVAGARANIERLKDLVPDEDPVALLAFVHACAEAVAHTVAGERSGARSLGLRSLHLALGNLNEEFPAMRGRVAPGLDSLDRMLGKVTDEAWHLLTEANETLQKEPVPVRPLQLLLGRLDTFRAFEAIIDRPQRSRSALLDRIESLRLRIEQAQATRDRLARGAEQALAKGHWTTGLFDMERAAQHIETSDDLHDRQAAHLKKRLVEARRRKQEIEEAQKRNHELQSRYAAMQDDPSSTPHDRQQVLREQRDCLQFLVVHTQKDRSALHARDLRDVELRLVQEQSQQAEAELDQTLDVGASTRIAERALRDLEEFSKGWGQSGELPGRLSRLLDHWRRRHAGLVRDFGLRTRQESRRRRRYRLAGVAIAAIVTVALVALQLTDDRPVMADAHPLATATQAVPKVARAAAEQLLRELQSIERQSDLDGLVTLAEIEPKIAHCLGTDKGAALFAKLVWEHALATAQQRTAEQSKPAFAREAAAALERLREQGLPQ